VSLPFGSSVSEPLATVMVNAHHSAYVEGGAITADPTLLPDYAADQPEPGVLVMVGDRDGWATLHRIQARDIGAGKIDFGPRIPWPDGSVAARKLPSA
jgi:hypothetical protein